MNDKFILLTTTENSPIIIGINYIALVEPCYSDPEKKETKIMLNFAKSKDVLIKTIYVKESFEQVKSILGL